jgi:lysophospholipase L1-like esterase
MKKNGLHPDLLPAGEGQQHPTFASPGGFLDSTIRKEDNLFPAFSLTFAFTPGMGSSTIYSLQKRLVGISLFFFVFSVALSAQDIDTTYLTSYYEQKVTQFRLLPDTKEEIIFLGNSITDIGEWAEIWQNTRVKNRGISSDNTFGVLARLDEVVSSKPSKIFILIGINDIAKGTPDSAIVSNYKKIIGRIQTSSPQTFIYVQSILPTNNEFTEYVRHQNKDQHIRAVNGELKKFCGTKKLVYVDLYSRFVDVNHKLDKRYTNDGLHLTGSGYMLWKKILTANGYMK